MWWPQHPLANPACLPRRANERASASGTAPLAGVILRCPPAPPPAGRVGVSAATRSGVAGNAVEQRTWAGFTGRIAADPQRRVHRKIEGRERGRERGGK